MNQIFLLRWDGEFVDPETYLTSDELSYLQKEAEEELEQLRRERNASN